MANLDFPASPSVNDIYTSPTNTSWVWNGTSWTSTGVPFAVSTTTSGTSAQVIDSFLLSTYRGAEYELVITNNSANGFQVSKIQVLSDGVNAYLTEFATMFSNGGLGIFTGTSNATHIQVKFTPVPAATTIKGTKNLIAV